MLQHCYYYNPVTGKSRRIEIKEMLDRAKENNEIFREMKRNLYRTDNQRIPMVFVSKGSHTGFRRKGDNTGNQDFISRGEYESFSHQGNKDVFSRIKEFEISFNNERVRLYIDFAETEKMVICNNSKYEVDVYYKLLKTDPAEYFDRWNGELWFEIFHTHEVSYKQAENFSIENKALFEFKIPDNATFYENISKEGYDKWVNILAERYQNRGVNGFLISNGEKDHYSWHNSQQGNLTFRSDDNYITVMKNKYGDGYVISLGKKKTIKKYNGKSFATIEDAVKVAEYFAFMIYNGHKPKEFEK